MDDIIVISDFPGVQYKKDSGTPALRLIIEALAQKYSVHLISPSQMDDGYPMIRKKHYVPARGTDILSRKLYPFLFHKKAYDIAKRICSKEDVKLVYGAGCLSTYVAGRLTWGIGIPSVGRLFGTYLAPHLNDPIRLATKYEEVLAFRSGCTKFIITDDGTGGDVVAEHFGIPGEDLYFWRNGVEVPPESPPRSDEKVRIISMARLDGWKRVDRAITAFLEVAASYKHVNLDIIGDGPERKNLQKIAFASHHLSKQIHFFGEVPRKRALELLAASDIFITTNDYSNVSNSLLEAMAAGKCIIALNTGDTASVLHDGETGFLVPYPDRLSEALFHAVAGAHTRKRLGENAKDYASHHFIPWDQRIANEMGICARLISQ